MSALYDLAVELGRHYLWVRSERLECFCGKSWPCSKRAALLESK